jgi:hypothetical protein
MHQPPLFQTTTMHSPELTEFEKGQIDGAHRFEHTIAEIHHKFGHAHFTIISVITCIKTHGISENKEHIGLPRKSFD